MAREARVQAVMAETGMGEMQAYRHVQAKDYLNTQMRRDPAFMRKHVEKMRAMVSGEPGEVERRDNSTRPWA